MKTPYEILDIPVSASSAQIKNAFRKKVKETHPDLNKHDSKAHEKFIELSNAYNILSNPDSKRKLDQILGKNSYSDSFNYNHTVGVDSIDISDIIRNLILQMHIEIEPHKSKAKKALLWGLAWFFCGLFITFISYSEAVRSGGGTYIITYGAIFFGFIQAIKGLIVYIKINKHISNYEKELWAKLDETI